MSRPRDGLIRSPEVCSHFGGKGCERDKAEKEAENMESSNLIHGVDEAKLPRGQGSAQCLGVGHQ